MFIFVFFSYLFRFVRLFGFFIHLERTEKCFWLETYKNRYMSKQSIIWIIYMYRYIQKFMHVCIT